MESLATHFRGRAKVIEIVSKRLNDEIGDVSSAEITATKSLGFDKSDTKFFAGGE